MSLPTKIAALATTTLGIALLAAPSQAQTDSAAAAAAAAPKATSDTGAPSSAARKQPAASGAPSTSMLSTTPSGETASAPKAQRGAGPQTAR